VVEHCEDDLPPRLVELELPHTYGLKREGSDRASFNIKLGAHSRGQRSEPVFEPTV
jgi:hypothetical protein